MSEIRQHILTKEWVIFADNRMKRPYDFELNTTPKELSHICGFCPGNEKMTTDAVQTVSFSKNAPWDIRVFPNKFPAVSPSEAIPMDSGRGLYTSLSGFGYHEILVDTPTHGQTPKDFSDEQLLELFKVLQQRKLSVMRLPEIKYVHIFKNCGPKAGASISHSHWQIVGLPFLPKEQSDIFENCKKYFDESKETLWERILKEEISEKTRIIMQTEDFLMFCPYASRFGFEINIAAKKSGISFEDFSVKSLKELGGLLRLGLKGVDKLSDSACYNIILNDAPLQKDSSCSNFYIRIIPRLGQLAGFEFGTRGYINHTYPEKASEFYRKALAL